MANSSISLEGIDQVIVDLKYRPGSAKQKAIMAIRNFYSSDESIKELDAIDTDTLIKSIWDIGDNSSKIKSKRRNFSSLRSSINTDLKKLLKKDKNPENIILADSNVFDLTQEAKDDLLGSFADAFKKGEVDLDQAASLLETMTEFLDKMQSEGKEIGKKDFADKIKKILDKITKGDLSDEGEGVVGNVDGEGKEDAKGDGQNDVGSSDLEKIELDENEEAEEIDELEEDDEEEIYDDALEVLEDENLNEDAQEIELDDVEEIDEPEELDDDNEEIELDEDEELEEIELDEDEELEEIDDLDDDIELEDDEEIEEIDDDLEEISDDDEFQELDEEEEVEEIDALEDIENIEEEEIESDDELEVLEDDTLDEDAEEIELDEDEVLDDVEEIEIDEDDELEDVEEIDESEEDVEEIELDEDEELDEIEDVDELDEDEHKALEEFREKRELAEQFDKTLGEKEKKYNKYTKVPKGLYTVGTKKGIKSTLELQQFDMPEVYIGIYPVINSLFEIFIEETGYITTAEKNGFGKVYYSRFKKNGKGSIWNKSSGSKDVKGACWHQPAGPESSLHSKRSHPVVQVSVDDAYTFASWIGRRIPTEAEWESTARTDFGYKYPWGNEFNHKALNIEETGLSDTNSVDEYDSFANEFQIIDMLGNIMEWTSDMEHPPFKSKQNIKYCVAKGGAWNAKDDVTISSRALFKPGFTSNTIGFRCISEIFL